MAVGIDRDAAVARCKSDLNFLAAIGVPEIFKYLFPPVFIAIWQLLTNAATEERGQKKLCIGIPRGFGKTILLKLWCLWLILFSDRQFILVVCNTASLAENFLADVVDLLDNPNVRAIFGDWRIAIEKDTLGLKKFTFRGRDIVLAGLGAQSSLRGLNLKYRRPDVIIMDDMQSKEEAQSPTEASRVLSWMIGTLMKANNKERCVFVFVGNMYPYEGSILKKLRKNPSWVSFICGAILADGSSLWPEYRSLEDILAELQDDEAMGHPEIFFAEVMNDDVAGSRSGFDITQFNIEEPVEDGEVEIYDGGYVLIDPSLGKKKSDDVAFGVVILSGARSTLREVLADKYNPAQQEDIPIKLCVRYGLRNIIVEAVAYQAVLVFHIKRKLAQLGLSQQINVREILPGREDKNSRIIDGLKRLCQKEPVQYALHRSVVSKVQHQTIYFDPMKKNNKDDILDLVAYMEKIKQKYGHKLLTLHEEEEATAAAYSDDLQTDF